MRKPVGKRLLPPATVGALPLDSTASAAEPKSAALLVLCAVNSFA